MYAFMIIMFNPSALKERTVPNRMSSMESTPKDDYEKVYAIGQVGFT